MVEWCYKLLVSVLTHPEGLVIGNGQVDALYAKAWPLAVTIVIAFLLSAASFMIVAFGKSAEHVTGAIKTAVIVFAGVWAARELSPVVLKFTGFIAGNIMSGADLTKPPFPYMGIGFGPWLAYVIDLVIVGVTVIMLITLAPMIIITSGLIMLSYALRLFGRAGEKQWQIFFSCWLNSHFCGMLLIAAAVHFSYSTRDSGLAKELAMVLVWVIFLIGLVLVSASFYLTYAASTYVSGGRLKADSHNDGGEIDRVNNGDRSEPQIHVDEVKVQGGNNTSDANTQPNTSGATPQLDDTPRLNVRGQSASSDGLDISLKRPTPSGVSASSTPYAPASTHGGTSSASSTTQYVQYPTSIPDAGTTDEREETEPPQWREESPVPPPSPYPDSVRTEVIPASTPVPEQYASDTTSVTGVASEHEHVPETAQQMIDRTYKELGLEAFQYPPQTPENEVKNEPRADPEPQLS